MTRPSSEEAGAAESIAITREEVFPTDLQQSEFTVSTYSRANWLQAIEKIRGKGVAYLVGRWSDGHIAAVLPAYWGDHTARGFYAPYGKYLHTLRPELDSATIEPCLVVGTRAGYSCEFLLNDRLGDRERVKVLARLLNHADALRNELRLASTAAMYIERHHLELARSAFTFDGRPCYEFATEPSARIRVPESFAAYLAGLTSSRSREVRRERRVFEAAGFSVAVEPGSHPALPRLLAQTESRYGHEGDETAEEQEADVFQAALGDQLLSFVLRHGDDVRGVATAISTGDTLSMRSLGLDYSSLKNAFEYFNLAFYVPIGWCAENGVEKLDWGIGSTEAKRRRGAVLEETFGLIRIPSACTPRRLDFGI